jgi:hypothetical protein
MSFRDIWPWPSHTKVQTLGLKKAFPLGPSLYFPSTTGLSRECLNLKCLPKPSFADMACRVGDMSATCLWSCRRLGDIACRLECLNDTTFDDMSPTLCTTEVHDCFVRGDFDRETMASSPAGSYHGLWWTDALDPVHLHDPDITGDAAM